MAVMWSWLALIMPVVANAMHIGVEEAEGKNLATVALGVQKALASGVDALLHLRSSANHSAPWWEDYDQSGYGSYMEWAKNAENPAYFFLFWHNICFELKDKDFLTDYARDVSAQALPLCRLLLLNGKMDWADGFAVTTAIPVRRDGGWNTADLNFCVGPMYAWEYTGIHQLPQLFNGEKRLFTKTLQSGPIGWVTEWMGTMPEKNTLLIQFPSRTGFDLVLGNGFYAVAFDIPKLRTYWGTSLPTLREDLGRLFTAPMVDLLGGAWDDIRGSILNLAIYPFYGAYSNPSGAWGGLFKKAVLPTEFFFPQPNDNIKLMTQPIATTFGRAQFCFSPKELLTKKICEGC